MNLSEVQAKPKTKDEIESAKGPKASITCGVDTDLTAMLITVPLLLRESDLQGRVKKTELNGATRFSANAACVFRTPAELEVKVLMDDGSIRHHRIRQNAGPYGPDRYINLGFDPTEFYTVPGETAADYGMQEEQHQEAAKA